MLATGLGVFLFDFKAGSALQDWSYDLLIVSRGDISVDGAVGVFIDERTYHELKQPMTATLDRIFHARLIERLTTAGAKAIVFDIVFSDPNTNNPSSDQSMADAMGKSGRTILAADYIATGAGESKFDMPFPLFREKMAGVGSAEVAASGDFVVREHTPDDRLPPLSAAAAEFIQPGVTQQDSQRQIHRWMNYYGPPNTLPWRSYSDALDPVATPDEFFHGKAVFIGARMKTKLAAERKDEYPNPFSR